MPAKAASEESVDVDGRTIDLLSRHRVNETEAAGLAAKLAGGMVVADRISKAAGRLLAEGGVAWLDRRGHLQLHGSSVIVDADVPPLLVAPAGRVLDPFVPTGLDVGIALLLEPDRPHPTVEVAHRIGRSPGRVSELLAGLRDRGLADREGRPALPDLFDEMADAWEPRWQPLGVLPTDAVDELRLSGTLGAVWHGAPVVATADWPAELYAPDEQVLRGLLRTYGATVGGPIAARVAVCPSRFGWSLAAGTGPDGLPVANHVVVALDLAQDRGRGREILEGWEPVGRARVW